MRLFHRTLAALLSLSMSPFAAAGYDLVGIVGGVPHAVELATGRLTPIGASSFVAAPALARGVAGELIVFSSVLPHIGTLDARSGRVAPLAEFRPSGLDVRAAARDASGHLYFAARSAPGRSTQLHRFDPALSQLAIETLGPVMLRASGSPLTSLEGLTFGLDGALVGFDALEGLVTIDVATLRASRILRAGTLGGEIAFLATRPDGAIVGGQRALYRFPLDGKAARKLSDVARGLALETAEFAEFGASATLYGEEVGGSGGAPQLTAGGTPQLGATLTLSLGNATGEPAPCLLLIGTRSLESQLRAQGVPLHVDFATALSFTLPALGASFDFEIPQQPALLERPVFLQAIVADATAPRGVAASRGLALWW
jgi:hypothetical protein